MTSTATRSKTETVFDAIISVLLSGRFGPREVFSEQDLIDALAERDYSVSRTPVREAVVLLSYLRIVKKLPKVGHCLWVADSDELRADMELRLALGSRALEVVASDPDLRSDVIDATTEVLAAMNRLARLEAADAEEIREFTRLDTEFHLLMADLAGLDRARDLIQAVRLREEFVRIDNGSSLDAAAMANVTAELEAIIEALRLSDADAAITSLENHLETSFDRLFDPARSRDIRSQVRADILEAKELRQRRSDLQRSTRLLRRALELAGPSGPLAAEVLLEISVTRRHSKDLVMADRYARQALAYADSAGDRGLRARAYYELGRVYLDDGSEESERLGEKEGVSRAFSIWKDRPDCAGWLAWANYAMALSHRPGAADDASARKRYEEAIDLLETALLTFEDTADAYGRATANQQLSYVKRRLSAIVRDSDPEAAGQILTQAVQHGRLAYEISQNEGFLRVRARASLELAYLLHDREIEGSNDIVDWESLAGLIDEDLTPVRAARQAEEQLLDVDDNDGLRKVAALLPST